VLLPGSSFDGGDDLSGDAELGKWTKLGESIVSKVADCFVEADHAFLDNVFAVCAHHEVGFCLVLDKRAVSGDQELGSTDVSAFGEVDDLFVLHKAKAACIGLFTQSFYQWCSFARTGTFEERKKVPASAIAVLVYAKDARESNFF